MPAASHQLYTVEAVSPFGPWSASTAVRYPKSDCCDALVVIAEGAAALLALATVVYRYPVVRPEPHHAARIVGHTLAMPHPRRFRQVPRES